MTRLLSAAGGITAAGVAAGVLGSHIYKSFQQSYELQRMHKETKAIQEQLRPDVVNKRRDELHRTAQEIMSEYKKKYRRGISAREYFQEMKKRGF